MKGSSVFENSANTQWAYYPLICVNGEYLKCKPFRYETFIFLNLKSFLGPDFIYSLSIALSLKSISLVNSWSTFSLKTVERSKKYRNNN